MKSVTFSIQSVFKWIIRGVGAFLVMVFFAVVVWIAWDLWSLEQMAKDFRSQLTENPNVFEFVEKNPRFYLISLDSPINQATSCPSLRRDFRELEMMRVVSAETDAQTQCDGKLAAAAGPRVTASPSKRRSMTAEMS